MHGGVSSVRGEAKRASGTRIARVPLAWIPVNDAGAAWYGTRAAMALTTS